MTHIPKAACAKCGLQMQASVGKNVLVTGERDGYYLVAADLYTCPECGCEVLAGWAKEVSGEWFEPNFKEKEAQADLVVDLEPQRFRSGRRARTKREVRVEGNPDKSGDEWARDSFVGKHGPNLTATDEVPAYQDLIDRLMASVGPFNQEAADAIVDLRGRNSTSGYRTAFCECGYQTTDLVAWVNHRETCHQPVKEAVQHGPLRGTEGAVNRCVACGWPLEEHKDGMCPDCNHPIRKVGGE
jgi:hypothetical protein